MTTIQNDMEYNKDNLFIEIDGKEYEIEEGVEYTLTPELAEIYGIEEDSKDD